MTDVEVLCATIDAGDDTAIAALADALEEAGDARAAGIRRVIKGGSRPYTIDRDARGVWWIDGMHNAPEEGRRLQLSQGAGTGQWAFPFARRSAALLALAAVLA